METEKQSPESRKNYVMEKFFIILVNQGLWKNEDAKKDSADLVVGSLAKDGITVTQDEVLSYYEKKAEQYKNDVIGL